MFDFTCEPSNTTFVALLYVNTPPVAEDSPGVAPVQVKFVRVKSFVISQSVVDPALV